LTLAVKLQLSPVKIVTVEITNHLIIMILEHLKLLKFKLALIDHNSLRIYLCNLDVNAINKHKSAYFQLVMQKVLQLAAIL
jgi:hypothetical protein